MSITDTQCRFEAGRGFGKNKAAYRAMTGQRLRMSKAPAAYAINAYGVVTRCAPWDNVVKFVPPYVPAKASRVYPALKTCTSPRRAAIARQRALFAASIGTPEQVRASGFKWYETDIKNAKITIDGHEITGAYTETSLGYTAR